MYVHSRFSRAGLRLIVGLLLSVALFSSTVGTLFAAGTTGSINGTVADATGTPLADVTVTATSPTGQFKTTTNAKGFFAILGMSPDTFVVSFTKQGFEQQLLTGINVVQDGSTELNVKLSKALKNIAKVSARGQAGAYQPDQTEDQYTLGQDQITTVQGRDKNTSESNILGSLPGASFDSSGYPVLRGGRENEEGYQFEGIPIVDAFTNQFTNSLSVNGINSFQLTPGAGNASNGNSGTGSVNFTVKRGTYPAFGSIEGEAQSEVYDHQLSLEYGFANPSGTFSNYFSFIGQRRPYSPATTSARSTILKRTISSIISSSSSAKTRATNSKHSIKIRSTASGSITAGPKAPTPSSAIRTSPTNLSVTKRCTERSASRFPTSRKRSLRSRELEITIRSYKGKAPSTSPRPSSSCSSRIRSIRQPMRGSRFTASTPRRISTTWRRIWAR